MDDQEGNNAIRAKLLQLESKFLQIVNPRIRGIRTISHFLSQGAPFWFLIRYEPFVLLLVTSCRNHTAFANRHMYTCIVVLSSLQRVPRHHLSPALKRMGNRPISSIKRF